MALNDVTVVRGQSGLGRPLPGEDYISGLQTYMADGDLPSGFSTSDRIKQILSVAAAEALGILGDYSDETRATGTITITNAGAAGDTIQIKIQEPVNLVNLGTYVRTAAATTATLVAVDLKNMINQNTSIHGYSATNALGVLTITFRKGLGIFPNSGTPISTVIVGTIARTIVQNVVAGVASVWKNLHYHISEYFRIQPDGNLWVQILDINGANFDFSEALLLQAAANNKIRQIAWDLTPDVADSAAGILAHCSEAQTICDQLEALHAPCSVIMANDTTNIADFTNLLDMNEKSCRSVSVCISQDGANLGSQIFAATGKTVSCLGAMLGAISLSAVNESQAWVQKFNMTDGLELSVVAFSNGTLINMVSDNALLNQLQTYRYCFLKYFTGVSGTFWNDNPTAISQASDYAYINDNRTIDKADRDLYKAYVPELSGPISLNRDGTLRDTTIAHLISVGGQALDPMVRAGEISGYEVTVNSTQKILTTNTLVVGVKLLPTGVARNITINTQFVTAIS